jgi:hypothetical protein
MARYNMKYWRSYLIQYIRYIFFVFGLLNDIITSGGFYLLRKM